MLPVTSNLTVPADQELLHLEGLLRKLNPKAKILRSAFAKVDLRSLLNTGSFNMAEAETMPGWYQVPWMLTYGRSFRMEKKTTTTNKSNQNNTKQKTNACMHAWILLFLVESMLLLLLLLL